MSKVFVHAMETISPLGVGLVSHMEGIATGRSGSGPLKRFDAQTFPTSFGCEVPADLRHLYASIHPDIVATFPYDRPAELFCCCAELIAVQVRALMSSLPSDRIGVFMGAGMEVTSIDYLTDYSLISGREGLEALCRQNSNLSNVNKILNPSHMGTLYAAALFHASGPRHTNLSACAASAQAVGNAFEAIRDGRCDVAITGGYDSTINPFIFAAFSQLHMISTRNDSPQTASRPFDMQRDGFVPGEGAGIMVLVNEAIADRWGTPLAEIAGYGTSLDAYKITAPHAEGLGAKLAMQRCLASAGWAPESVEYINAHGTSTPLNDQVEALALSEVFGNALTNIPVSSTKSQIGHLIAAGGIVECITVVGAMQQGIYPASINVTRPDPACPVALVREPGTRGRFRRAISNSFALAGQNATLAIAAV